MNFGEIKTIAVVGLSPNPAKPSYQVARYLQSVGFRVIPVNPKETEILGEKSYPDLASIPPEIEVDLVDIFRRPEEVEPVVAQAVARGVKRIWMQEGVVNEKAAALARAAGAEVVMDRCLMKEHRRLAGSQADAGAGA